ncbi:MAG: hypothetical protein C5B49_03940 [Bdellovibrio sp.]|nr:MAG: hypothetical protein C5B49_03940 [Bdellovibrio sp.]
MLGLNADRPRGERIPIYHCANCGLTQSDVSAIQESFEELYFDGYYGDQQEPRYSVLLNLFQWCRRRLAMGELKEGQVLDVGCGDGSFLRALPTTYQKFGFEPSNPGQASLHRAGIQTVDIFSETKRQFDLITMWHSLEHISNPKQTVGKLKGLLRDGGRLFISVPYRRSLQACVFAGRWFHLDPTRHLIHFDKGSLRALLTGSGFEIVKESTFSLEYNVFGWWQSLLNLLPFEFNWAYKRLKRGAPQPQGFAPSLRWVVYMLFGLIFLPVAVLCSLAEAALGLGGVINVTAVPLKSEAPANRWPAS